MEVIEPAKTYVIKDSQGKEIVITFCHRNSEGAFIHGIMSEDLMEVLIHRQEFFVIGMERASTHNINILTFLKQAFHNMRQRNFLKSQRRHENNKGHIV